MYEESKMGRDKNACKYIYGTPFPHVIDRSDVHIPVVKHAVGGELAWTLQVEGGWVLVCHIYVLNIVYVTHLQALQWTFVAWYHLHPPPYALHTQCIESMQPAYEHFMIWSAACLTCHECKVSWKERMDFPVCYPIYYEGEDRHMYMTSSFIVVVLKVLLSCFLNFVLLYWHNRMDERMA